jgi:hypothetical protein
VKVYSSPAEEMIGTTEALEAFYHMSRACSSRPGA